ncbi:hypothetical protein TVNIR_3334 [Thioalkalivibrio nitratireducens DSM 14787]|uniref:Uncharacterized protein n=1 Tax=Thioalkalivibrio nitratireducens (strain DSM 14787 / UNIQEM 213 / ALEN2) TaxID=1255043 RepID=L0E190_THIND|nr:hypothetical protein TVNIR_3334 [Thioalkalivibrio nitratireducens DSM 14787]
MSTPLHRQMARWPPGHDESMGSGIGPAEVQWGAGFTIADRLSATVGAVAGLA